MEPLRRRACEALTESLARGKQNDSNNKAGAMHRPQPNSQQQAMGIPPHLIYLVGLLGLGSPPFSPSDQDLFEELQRLYHNVASEDSESAMKIFQLSPSMLPSSSDDQEQIQQDIQQKMQQLEEQARQVEQELLQVAADEQEALEQQANKKKAAAQKPNNRNKRHQQPMTTTTSKEEDNDREDQSPQKKTTETLQQVLAQIQVPYHQTDDMTNNNGDNSGWVPVGKKAKAVAHPTTNTTHNNAVRKKTNTSTVDPPGKTTSLTSDDYEEWPEDENVVPKEEEPFKDKNNIENDSSIKAEADTPATLDENDKEDMQEIAKDSLPTDKTTSDKPDVTSSSVEESTIKTPDDSNSVHELQDRVRQLEQALSQSEQDREALKAKHEQKLRKERETSEERIQALQLRLYISETRLKTYEDALQQHMDAVANNVAMGSPDHRSALSHHHNNNNNFENRGSSSPSRPMSRILNQSVTQHSE